MKWQNPHALKRVKTEVEACAVQMGSALESVIVTPPDVAKDLEPLRAAVKDFARIPGTLRMLGFTQLALLAQEIQQVLHDTLRPDAALESRDLELRCEAAFVAVTDLPALLECALRRSGDSFELVFRLVNRLRKARDCAVVFAASALLKNEEVSFRKQFATQQEKMQGLLAKQADYLQKAAAALVKNNADAKALSALGTVFENLELMLRDHRQGVLWGLARAVVDVYDASGSDKAVLAGCFWSLVPHAQGVATRGEQLHASLDEALLERVVNFIAAAKSDQGRPGIIKLWYNLNLASAKTFRADYRDIQVRYYNKGALMRCMTLVSEECKRLMDVINEQAEAAAISREQTREIYLAIARQRDVLRLLQLHYLSDLIAARLPPAPGEKLEEALALAASLLFRVNNELECKLERMEREVFATDAAHAAEDALYAGRARILHSALQTLEAAALAFDEYMAGAGAETAAAAHLLQAQDKLETLTNVLAAVKLNLCSAQFAVARDYVAWLRTQTAPAAYGAQHALLAQLLVHGSGKLEALVFGREGAQPDPAAAPAAALKEFLAARLAEMQPNAQRLVLVAPKEAEDAEPEAAAAAPDAAVLEPAPIVQVSAEPVPEPVVEQAAASHQAPIVAEAAPPPKEGVEQELLATFLEEADELLQSLDTLFLAWRQAPHAKTCVDEYLRVLHTMKGSAALVLEHELSRLAHEFETFINDACQRKRDFDAAFFAACDSRLHALHDVYGLYHRDANGHLVKAAPTASAPVPVPEHSNAAPDSAPENSCQVPISAAAEPSAKFEPGTNYGKFEPGTNFQKYEPGTNFVAAEPAAPGAEPAGAAAVQDDAPAPDELIRVSSKLLRALSNDADELNFSRSRVETGFQEIAALLLDMDATLSRFKACVNALDHQALKPPARAAREDFRSDNGRHAEFDALEMDRYTELQELAVSLAENYDDLQDIRGNLGMRVKDIGSILDGQQRVTNGLQDGLILTQLVPFASVVPRLARLVRQIGTRLQKPVRLEVENQQGSLDRNVLQAIVTPLEHIIRNAIDHGVEATAVRRQHGKPDEATLRITVARRGATFRIEIRDDGQGIDVDKVRQRALSNGLLQPDAVITEQEAFALLFRSGFSTAAAVSNISGRGVGLDVVKSEITQIGGTVEIESVRGAGAAFIINLPLTSSLNRALVFGVQETRYAVLMNTLDGVLVEKLATVHQKQQDGGAPVFEYGGRRYEYLYLGKLLDPGLNPRLDSIDSSIALLLVSGAAANYALHIDTIVESRDLVVKSFGQQFAALPGIAGGVILPDGNVAIVLDLKAMLAQPGKDKRAGGAPFTLKPQAAADRARKLVMVVDDSVTVRKATSAMLKRNGMDVLTARNGLEAVELLETQLPDLILLDIEMPRMDGFEVASFIRAQSAPVRDIPIIMITSRIGEKHRSRAEAIGVNEYLCKPFKEDSLLQSIHGY